MRTHPLAAMAMIFLGIICVACKKPDVQFSPRPIDQVELAIQIKGINPGEEIAMRDQLSRTLQLPVTPIPERKRPLIAWLPGYALFHRYSVTSKPEAQDSSRVFQVTVRGSKSSYSDAGLPKTVLINTGYGMAAGGLLGGGAGIAFTSWPATAIGSGVGGIIGIAMGPMTFHAHEATRKTLGYLPWGYSCHWLLLSRNKDHSEKPLASGRLDILSRPFLRPLIDPPPSDKAIREENLHACNEAMGTELKQRLGPLTNGIIPKY